MRQLAHKQVQHQIRGGKAEQEKEKRANTESEKNTGSSVLALSLCKGEKWADNFGGKRENREPGAESDEQKEGWMKDCEMSR